MYLGLDETARDQENTMRDMTRTADSLVSQLNEADQAALINEQRTLREDFYKYEHSHT